MYLVEISEIFSQSNTLQGGYMHPKMIFFNNLVLVLEMAVFEHFW